MSRIASHTKKTAAPAKTPIIAINGVLRPIFFVVVLFVPSFFLSFVGVPLKKKKKKSQSEEKKKDSTMGGGVKKIKSRRMHYWFIIHRIIIISLRFIHSYACL